MPPHRGGGSHGGGGGGGHRSGGGGMRSSSHNTGNYRNNHHGGGGGWNFFNQVPAHAQHNRGGWGWGQRGGWSMNSWGYNRYPRNHIDVYLGGRPYYPSYPWQHGFWPWQPLRRMGGMGQRYNNGVVAQPTRCECNNMHCCGCCGTPATTVPDSVGRTAIICNPCCLIIFYIIFSLIMMSVCFSSTNIMMDAGETRIVPMYGFLHKGVSINDYSNRISVYQMHSKPKLIFDDTKKIKISETDTLGPDAYIDFGYWLNKGSTISCTFQTTSQSAAYLYIWQGDRNFNNWEYDEANTLGLVSSKYSSHGSSSKLTYVVDEDDTYYAVFDNDYGFAGDVQFDLTIDRTQYDVSSHTPVCIGSPSCHVKLHFMGGEDYVILESPDSDPSKQQEETFDIEIEPDTRWMIAGALLLMPIAILMSFAVIASFMKPDLEYRDVEPLLDNEENGNRDNNMNGENGNIEMQRPPATNPEASAPMATATPVVPVVAATYQASS